MVAAAAFAEIGFAFATSEELALGRSLTADAALARSASRGDRQAFGRLVDLHKRAVYGLCFRLLRDPEDARDAAQECFVRAYSALDTYDPGQPFVPWILRIARNHCLDLVRRRVHESRRVELNTDPECGPVDLADPAAVAPDVALERRETAATLAQAVDALPPAQREVVHLFHVEHLSYKEIAATLDVPIGTVMTWLHRARARLRLALEQGAKEALP
jgi:RNA polymerase sigma-70 factor (ECF subfamily)